MKAEYRTENFVVSIAWQDGYIANSYMATVSVRNPEDGEYHELPRKAFRLAVDKDCPEELLRLTAKVICYEYEDKNPNYPYFLQVYPIPWLGEKFVIEHLSDGDLKDLSQEIETELVRLEMQRTNERLSRTDQNRQEYLQKLYQMTGQEPEPDLEWP